MAGAQAEMIPLFLIHVFLFFTYHQGLDKKFDTSDCD
jgi:hypothetical protein